MGPIRIDPLGFLDLLVGVMLVFTTSPVPSGIAMLHAFFLIFKGISSILRPVRLPLPVFVLGGFADIMSAGILFFGNPPVLAAYTPHLAAALFVKGIWSFLGILRL